VVFSLIKNERSTVVRNKYEQERHDQKRVLYDRGLIGVFDGQSLVGHTISGLEA